MSDSGIFSSFSLEGHNALVTGAGRGIGRSIAVGMASAGAHLVLLARTNSELEATARIIRTSGGKASMFPADLGTNEDVAALVESAAQLVSGPIDVVVHAAGVQHRQHAQDFSAEAWERVIRLNLTAPFLLSKAIGRQQLSESIPGSHIFITSLASVIGLPNMVAYNAAKSGLRGVVRALSTEWSREGIRVNAIAPGYVRTKLTADLLSDPSTEQQLLERIPMGRLAEPWELAAVAVFLASRASTYITGQTLCVDGGWTAS